MQLTCVGAQASAILRSTANRGLLACKQTASDHWLIWIYPWLNASKREKSRLATHDMFFTARSTELFYRSAWIRQFGGGGLVPPFTSFRAARSLSLHLIAPAHQRKWSVGGGVIFLSFSVSTTRCHLASSPAAANRPRIPPCPAPSTSGKMGRAGFLPREHPSDGHERHQLLQAAAGTMKAADDRVSDQSSRRPRRKLASARSQAECPATRTSGSTTGRAASSDDFIIIVGPSLCGECWPLATSRQCTQNSGNRLRGRCQGYGRRGSACFTRPPTAAPNAFGGPIAPRHPLP